MFVGLTVVYVIVFEIVTAKREKAKRSNSEANPGLTG